MVRVGGGVREWIVDGREFPTRDTSMEEDCEK